jgi:hypothetical protein
MYNPFVLLNEKLLTALLRQPLYFAREYYARGRDQRNDSIPILLTHYTQEGVDKERAKRHFELLKKDAYRFLYDSTNEEHVQKLMAAARQPKGYTIYVNILPRTWTAPHHLRSQIYQYMLATYPDWQKDSNKKLKINIQDLFGQLYLLFTWQGNKVEVILDEIEKY